LIQILISFWLLVGVRNEQILETLLRPAIFFIVELHKKIKLKNPKITY